ncbi:two-component sensor histidine kinase [Lactobacillus xylocopicola]|uniref:histidine kinase n=2 Tax=Lactobacillus xylocopicola TaxID=2976676 RepID=A0ABN6SLW5_9LACO|nr:two-component sensor histidine kinase [Lactobacillus xylocopicola]
MTLLLAGLALFDPSFIYFFPVIVRVTLLQTKSHKLLLLVIPLLIQLNWLKLLVLLACLLACYFAYEDRELDRAQQEKRQLQDDSFEQLLTLQQQKLDLETNEQTKLMLQLANERNRIARDIHDNVGHLLSSSIIQLGAVTLLNQDAKLTKPLTELNTTVNRAMDSIRNSVHGIQAKALTLSQALKPIIADFTFCTLQIAGHPFDETSFKQNQIIVMTVKEAFTNVLKHSNASLVTLKFQTLPAFYQVQIADNGTSKGSFSRGMGLASMQQRAEEVGGQLHLYQGNKGFSITLILPRKEENVKNSLS